MGTELLLGEVIDTNSSYLAKVMSSLGVDVFRKTTVGDNLSRIKTSLQEGLSRTNLIIISGGLGPTEDDVTKEAAGVIFQKKLIFDENIFKGIQRKYTHHPIPRKAIIKQSMIPEGATIIPNSVGTAPGIIMEEERKTVILLPGVPEELKAMVPRIIKHLSGKISSGQTVIKSRTLKLFGPGESQVNKKISPLMSKTNPTVALLAKKGEVHIRITAKFTSEEVDHRIQEVENVIRGKWGDYIFGADEETLEGIVGKLLIDKNFTISVAESCSGGLVAHRLTNIPGISASFLCGLISYSNEAKSRLLEIPPELIKSKGAVSSEVAQKMARQARALINSDISVGITGIAGPTGGTPQKPVGLVYIALSTEEKDICQKYHFPGRRKMVKWKTSQAALDLVRKYVLGISLEH